MLSPIFVPARATGLIFLIGGACCRFLFGEDLTETSLPV
jgi:hypothetical protein